MKYLDYHVNLLINNDLKFYVNLNSIKILKNQGLHKIFELVIKVYYLKYNIKV